MKLFHLEPYDPEKIIENKSSREIADPKEDKIFNGPCLPVGLYEYLTTCPYPNYSENTSKVYGIGFIESVETEALADALYFKQIKHETGLSDATETGIASVNIGMRTIMLRESFIDETSTSISSVDIVFRELLHRSYHEDATNTSITNVSIHFDNKVVMHSQIPDECITSISNVSIHFE